MPMVNENVGVVGNVVVEPERIQPTLFLGLGGTGLKVLARFRQRIADIYGKPGHWPCHAMLGIDTNEKDLARGGRSSGSSQDSTSERNDASSAGGRGLPLEPGELFDIGVSEEKWKDVLDNLQGKYSHINEWLPTDVKGMNQLNLTEGAGQIRAAGRASFILKLPEFKQRISDLLRELKTEKVIRETREALLAKNDQRNRGQAIVEGQGRVKVIIIAGAGGGTGSGSLLDCAYLLRYLKEFGSQQIGSIDGMILLPDAFHSVLDHDKRQKAKVVGYALLRELEYYSSRFKVPFNYLAWGLPDGYRGPLEVPPFNASYLLGGTNAEDVACASDDDLYDVMADHLVISTLGTKLGGVVAGAQSNAQGQLFAQPYRYYEEPSYDLGGESREGNDKNAWFYLDEWSQRFSSFGVAMITMKKYELKRIAMCNLLRRMIDREIGSISENDEQALKRDSERLDDLRPAEAQSDASKQRITEAIQAAAARTSAEDVKADAFSLGRYRSIYRDLTVRQPELEATRVLRNTSAQSAKQRAETVYHTLIGRLGRPPFRGLKHVMRALALRAEWATRQQTALTEPGEPTYERSSALNGLMEMQLIKGPDLFNRKRKALRIYQEQIRNHLLRDFKAYTDAIETAVANHYYEHLKHQLQDYYDRLSAATNWLQKWADGAADTQNKLAAEFTRTRNWVVTSDLAVSKGAPDEPQLTAEVEAAVARATGDKAREDVIAATEWLLTHLAADDQEEQEMQKGSAAQRAEHLFQLRAIYHDEGVIKRRVETLLAYQLLQSLPREQNIFKLLKHWIASGKVDLKEKLTALKRQSSPAWRVDQKTAGSEYQRRPFSKIRAVSAATPTEEGADVCRKTEEFFKSHDNERWNFELLDEDNAKFAGGDLVLIQEFHAVAIPALGAIHDFRDAYDQINFDERRHSHLDFSLEPYLPQLVLPGTFDRVLEVVRTWDVALLSIILGIARWDEQVQQFMLKVNSRFEEQAVGTGYQQIARWLMLQHGRTEALREKIAAWFEERMRTIEGAERFVPGADKPSDKADTAAGAMIAVELILELIEKYSIPSEVQSSDRQIASPERVMLKRIVRDWLEPHVPVIEHCCGHEGLATIRARVESKLQEGVKFVGKRPEGGRPSMLNRKSLLRLSRQLQLTASGTKNPEAVMNEAFEDKWDETAKIRAHFKTLFPHRKRDLGADVEPVAL